MLMLVLTVQFVKPKVHGSRGGSKNGPTTPCFGAPGSAEGFARLHGNYLRISAVNVCFGMWAYLTHTLFDFAL